MVPTLIVSAAGPVVVTVTGEGEPAHVALEGTPVQLTVAMSRSGAAPPTNESWRWYVAVSPAFTVAEVEPPEATPMEKSVPVPVRETDCGLSLALSVMVTAAERFPVAVGVNVKLMVQFKPAARVAGLMGHVLV